MSVVVGTAGHIDHGKTTLLRALTGIDADRLPEERRRGMTIDVGYAHLPLADGSVIDLVDVPGHDRLVGNMLVGAGEIDAALLVVAADDGPSAQTIEHLELLDALGIGDGVVAVTKVDTVEPARVAEVAAAIAALVGRTRLAGAPVLAVSGVTGDGIEALRAALAGLRDRVLARRPPPGGAGGPRLAVDRAFPVRGRGTVVTGTLRGGAVAPGTSLRVVPGDVEVRVREVQVRGVSVPVADGGRTALLLAGSPRDLGRGQVLTANRTVGSSSRLLVAMRPPAGLAQGLAGRGSHGRPGAGPGRATAGAGSSGAPDARPDRVASVPADRDHVRVHVGTAQAGALVVRGPREAVELPGGWSVATLRLDGDVAVAAGDRFALRWPSPGSAAGGGFVPDPAPPRGVARRRLTPERLATLAAALTAAGPSGGAGDAPVRAALLELHGARATDGAWELAADVAAAMREAAVELVRAHHAAEPESPGLPLPVVRAGLAHAARRRVTLGRAAADELARDLVDRLVADHALARDGDRLRDPARAAGLPPATLAAMDRLEAALSVAAPPSLAAAARGAGCPPDGIRALVDGGRIVRLEDDLAWAAGTYRDLARRALSMAAVAPLSPAAYRDATGSSRRYVLVILEDLDRRGLLRRTDAGHVPGPRMIARVQAGAERSAGTRTGPADEVGR